MYLLLGDRLEARSCPEECFWAYLVEDYGCLSEQRAFPYLTQI